MGSAVVAVDGKESSMAADVGTYLNVVPTHRRYPELGSFFDADCIADSVPVAVDPFDVAVMIHEDDRRCRPTGHPDAVAVDIHMARAVAGYRFVAGAVDIEGCVKLCYVERSGNLAGVLIAQFDGAEWSLLLAPEPVVYDALGAQGSSSVIRSPLPLTAEWPSSAKSVTKLHDLDWREMRILYSPPSSPFMWEVQKISGSSSSTRIPPIVWDPSNSNMST